MTTTFEPHYANHELPLWTRVILYAADHDGQPLARGQLRTAVDPLRLAYPTDIWRAIRLGVTKGVLAPESHAGRLHLAPTHDQHQEPAA